MRPLLETTTSIFCAHKQKYIAVLKGAQDKFTRKILFRTERVPHAEVFCSLQKNKIFGIEPAEQRRKINNLLLAYKNFSKKKHVKLSPCRFFSQTLSKIRGVSFRIAAVRSKTQLRSKIFVLECWESICRKFRSSADILRCYGSSRFKYIM